MSYNADSDGYNKNEDKLNQDFKKSLFLRVSIPSGASWSRKFKLLFSIVFKI